MTTPNQKNTAFFVCALLAIVALVVVLMIADYARGIVVNVLDDQGQTLATLDVPGGATVEVVSPPPEVPPEPEPDPEPQPSVRPAVTLTDWPATYTRRSGLDLAYITPGIPDDAVLFYRAFAVNGAAWTLLDGFGAADDSRTIPATQLDTLPPGTWTILIQQPSTEVRAFAPITVTLPPLAPRPLGPSAPSPGAAPGSGWSTFTRSADTRVIYVSVSGSDANDGLSTAKPVKTAAKGYKLLRNGKPDWLLFKAGDTFSGGLGYWTKSGRSADAQMLVGSYGNGARPRFKTNGGGFINISHKTKISYVAFVGLHLYANQRDPDSPDFIGGEIRENGVRWLIASEGILFEDCLIEFFAFGMIFEPFQQPTEFAQKNLTIRRCIVRNSHVHWPKGSVGGNSAGIFIASNDGVTIEDSVLDHNGWNERVNGSTKTVFNHNMYIHHSRNVSVVGNVIARSANLGLKIRSDITGKFDGLVIKDNLFLGNTNNISIGGNRDKTSGKYQPYSTKNVLIARNAFTQSGGVLRQGPNDVAQSIGVIINTSQNAVIEDNVFFDKDPFGTSVAIKIETWLAQKNVLVQRNVVHEWDRGSVTATTSGVTSRNNLVDLEPSRYVDASRTIAGYSASLGGQRSWENFLDEAAKQSKRNWRDGYTGKEAVRYVLDGFELKENK